MEGFLAFAATHCATLCSKLRTLLSLGQPPEKRWSDAVPCISRATFRTVHVPCFALCLIVGAAGALFGGLGIAQHNDRYSFPADNCTVANSIVIDDACSCSVPHKDQGREANKCRVPSCNDVSPCLQITAQSSALPSPTPLYLHIWALGLSDRCIYGQPPHSIKTHGRRLVVAEAGTICALRSWMKSRVMAARARRRIGTYFRRTRRGNYI